MMTPISMLQANVVNHMTTLWYSKSMQPCYRYPSAQEVPFVILLYMQCILYGLASALLCVPVIFAHHEKCRFCGRHVMLPFITEIVRNFHSGYCDCRSSFKQLLIHTDI